MVRKNIMAKVCGSKVAYFMAARREGGREGGMEGEKERNNQ
jgi:hypothetical protein